MPSRRPTSRSSRTGDALGLGLICVILALHVHFAVVDARLATDLGHYYRGAIEAARAGMLDGGVRFGFAEPGYFWFLAAVWGWLGPSQGMFEAIEAVWLGALCVGAWLSGRALGGGGGAAIAVAGVALFPMFATGARTHWIHHPEVSAAALGLGLALTLPRRWWAGVVVGAILGVGATVRPSAVVWLSLPMAVWAWRCGWRRWMWWTPAVGLFALGVAAHGTVLVGYLGLRLANRGANAAAVGSPFALLHIQTGIVPGVLFVGLAGAALRRLTRPELRPGLLVGLAWLGGGMAVLAVTSAGPDNVPTAFFGLVLLASAVDLRGWGAGVLAAVLGLLVVLGPGTQVVPALGVVPIATGWDSANHPLNFSVPRSSGVDAEQVIAAARAACPPDLQPVALPARERRPCRVLLQMGLAHPSWEEDGALGLFLAGWGGVQAQAAPGLVDRRRFDVAVRMVCTGPALDAAGRFPEAGDVFEHVAAGLVERARVRGNGCTQIWLGR